MKADIKREVEEALYNAVPHGAYKALADHRNIARQNVSKYYDYKSGEYQSVFSKALLELEVIARDEVSPEWARAILKVFNFFGVKWCGPVKLSGNALEQIGSIAFKLMNGDTPESERGLLAARLVDLANRVAGEYARKEVDDRLLAVDEKLADRGLDVAGESRPVVSVK